MGMPTPSKRLLPPLKCKVSASSAVLAAGTSVRAASPPAVSLMLRVGSWNRVGTRNPNRGGNIDYRLMCYGNGHSSGHGNVFVTGLPGPATKWTPNDVFEVRVTDNTVSYLKNGLVFHTIAQVPGGGLPKGHCPTCATPTFPMHADFLLASVGDGFTDVNMLSCK